jgi:hypothetical protein
VRCALRRPGRAGGDLYPTLRVLTALIGRAAFVWSDSRHPGIIWFARTAISPLALARDADGTLYWASNPGWFRHASAAGVHIAAKDIRLIPEGVLLRVGTRGTRPRLTGPHTFTATARLLDEQLLHDVAHPGFSNADREPTSPSCATAPAAGTCKFPDTPAARSRL